MKIIYLLIMLVILSVGVTANTCFTIVNTPTNTKLYWKAISYDIIKDNEFSNYLEKTSHITAKTGLGPGYQYNIRVDKDCFGSYLLSNKDNTGIDSGTLYIQQRIDDYYDGYPKDRMYTISLREQESISSSKVKDIKTGIINEINYLQKPIITDEIYKEIKSKCNPNLNINEQIDIITAEVWDKIDYSNENLNCQGYNDIVSCALNQGKGNSKIYATTIALLSRECGIPTRIIHGISEGEFDGIDIKFKEDKMHYWVEFYDKEWYNVDVTESGPTIPDSIEINCIDGIDNDKDGLTDCQDDKCSNKIFCQGSYPTTIKFKNSYSTDLTKLPNAYSINDLKIGNEFGSIIWENQNLDLRNKNLDDAIDITENKIAINEKIPNLNTDAIIKLQNIMINNPTIIKNNVKCEDCEIISYKNKELIFKIVGLGVYTIKDASKITAQESNTNQTQNSNQTSSYLPPIPPTKDYDKIGNIGTKFKELMEKAKALPDLQKVIIIVAIIGIIWWWRKKRNQGGYNAGYN